MKTEVRIFLHVKHVTMVETFQSMVALKVQAHLET